MDVQTKAMIEKLEARITELENKFEDLNERHDNTCVTFKKLTDSVVIMAKNINKGFNELSLRVDVIQDSLIQDKCIDCHEHKKDVETRFCPYAQEISGVNKEITVCNDCYHERSMEI